MVGPELLVSLMHILKNNDWHPKSPLFLNIEIIIIIIIAFGLLNNTKLI